VAGIELNPASPVTAVYGQHTGGGPAVYGTSQSGPGVFGTSQGGEGVHGETNSTKFAAVAGIELNPASPVTAVYGQHNGVGPAVYGTSQSGPGVFGTSQGGEGVHGISHAQAAGIAGYNDGTGAGVYGENTKGQGPAGFFKGNVVVTGDVQVFGADCAEQFDVIDAPTCDPGTVMVIDEAGALMSSCQEYDRRVAGVISGAGGLLPGMILGEKPDRAARRPIALVGKVYCKVSAEYSPIELGDLLTTSATPGHAMKAVDRSLAFGAVLGKALHPLTNGKGLIPILIALQ
jgi:hypothetical protein